MGADEQPSPTRKRDREEVDELADGGAAEKRPRAEGTSLLGLASYEDDEEEEAARGQANGHRAEGEDGEERRSASRRRPLKWAPTAASMTSSTAFSGIASQRRRPIGIRD